MISRVVSLLELNSYMHVMTFIRLQLTGCQMSGFTVKLVIVITHPFMPAIGVIVLLRTTEKISHVCRKAGYMCGFVNNCVVVGALAIYHKSLLC